MFVATEDAVAQLDALEAIMAHAQRRRGAARRGGDAATLCPVLRTDRVVAAFADPHWA